jgi:hypothetical protein
MAMFREVGYGVCFFLSAALGGFLGLTCLVSPVRGGTHESQMWEDVRAILFGVLAGGLVWLAYKYRLFAQPKDEP